MVSGQWSVVSGRWLVVGGWWWCGALWCGVVWCCVVLCCVVWCGVVWCGVVRSVPLSTSWSCVSAIVTNATASSPTRAPYHCLTSYLSPSSHLPFLTVRSHSQGPRRGGGSHGRCGAPRGGHAAGESWSVGSDRTHQTPPTRGHRPDPSTKTNTRPPAFDHHYLTTTT